MEEKNKHTNHLDERNVTSPGVELSMLETIVEELCKSNNDMTHFFQKGRQCHSLPSRDVIMDTIEDIRSVLFPGYFGNSELTLKGMRFCVGSTLDRILRTMQDQIKYGLCFVCEGDLSLDRCIEYDEKALSITKSFLAKLPSVRRLLMTDVKAAYEGDPAATSIYETIFCYPGVLAITNYRLAHELYVLRVPLIPRIITEYAHSITGIDIHPGAVIDESFFIDHGTGVVIGETCIIGKNVRIYQGVTLGAKSFPLDDEGKPIKGIKRHPIIEDNVIIYSGATILGPVVIGKGSVIEGNVWLTHSVPSRSRITQMGAREKFFKEGEGI